ncbi:MAG: gluconeogenesis factor YvcK family protein [Acidimicrobiales bacterium]
MTQAPDPDPPPAAGPRVVALGGGHGLATTLAAARRYAGRVCAVVSVADDGGSSGRLRQSFGIPAPGDLRRCLVAMADPASVWARAFEHRFASGELEGHAVGNLVIAGLAEVTGDFVAAVDEAARLLGVQGRVLPASAVPVVLKAVVAGREVLGQVRVAGAGGPISGVSIVPPDAPAPAEVVRAISEADQVVLGPGSLFTSVLATCAVADIRAALARRRGGRVYVCNLRPQRHETDGFSAADHLAALRSHGVEVDTMVYDPAGLPPGPVARHWPRLVAADLGTGGGAGHDVGRLSSVLATLAATGRGLASRPADRLS